MFVRKFIFLCFSIFFVLKNVHGAPTNGTSSLNKTLETNPLLSNKTLPFLDSCYNTKPQSSLCALYIDGEKQLSEAKIHVAENEIEEILKKSDNDTDFCKRKPTFFSEKYSKTNITTLLISNCSGYCMSKEKPLPICSIMSLMANRLVEPKNSEQVILTNPAVPKTDQPIPVKTSVTSINVTSSSAANITTPNKEDNIKLTKEESKIVTEPENKKELLDETEKEAVHNEQISPTVKIPQEDNDSFVETEDNDDSDANNDEEKLFGTQPKNTILEEIETKPETQPGTDPFYEESGSNFFTYFLLGMFISILVYVLYHNKAKILGLLLEGRRSQKRRTGSRRKHTAAYRKLDSNLEEAMTSSTSGRSSQVIY